MCYSPKEPAATAALRSPSETSGVPEPDSPQRQPERPDGAEPPPPAAPAPAAETPSSRPQPEASKNKVRTFKEIKKAFEDRSRTILQDRIQYRLVDLRKLIEETGFPNPEREMGFHIPVWSIFNPTIYYDKQFTTNFALDLARKLGPWTTIEQSIRLGHILESLIRDHQELSLYVVPEEYRVPIEKYQKNY